MNTNNYAVIMAGGIGSPLCPAGRTGWPKQFLDVLNSGCTLLQATYSRFAAFILPENIFVVTPEEYIPLVKQQLPQLPEASILGEPEQRNTAAAMAYAAFKIHKANPNANMVATPGDHLITDWQAFRQVCTKALAYTENSSALLTIGIEPTYPNTGCSYIRITDTAVAEGIFHVKRFTGKPNALTAEAFVASGAYLWNAGIFIWNSAAIMGAFQLHCPEIYNQFTSGLACLNTSAEKETVSSIYRQCSSISINYAIVEKAANVYAAPAALGWSDLSAWNSA